MIRIADTTPLLIALLLLAGCSLLGGGERERSQRRVIDVGALEVEVLGTSAQRVAFAFKGRLPVPCYEFEDVVVERDGRTVNVRVRARSTAEICVTVIGVLRVSPLGIDVPGEGSYVFTFWRGSEKKPLKINVAVP